MNATNDTQLVDTFGRQVTYLRLSVTDRCDFRCVYCMAEDMTFLPRAQVLSLEEIERIARIFVGLGVNKIRLTGGEPLVRRGIDDLAGRLSRLPGLRELCMTTNAGRLEQFADALAEAGVSRLNISLDSLDPARFRRLTRTGDLERVLAGVRRARQAGFERIKLNTVVLRGRNDDEVESLAAFALEQGLDISFIEEMPLGVITEHSREEAFISSAELRERLSRKFRLEPVSETSGGPSRYFRVPGHRSRIGFISPHSENFCASCNRVRLTVEGRLLLCLGNEHATDLRDLVRRHDDDTPVRQAIIAAMALKPERHHFESQRDNPQILRFMNATGG